MLRLAGPVVVAELGWMAMGIVNTIVVGPLGAEATGAVGLGSNLYIAAAIFGIGLLLGLDTAGLAGARRRPRGRGPRGAWRRGSTWPLALTPAADARDPGDGPAPAPAGDPATRSSG